MDKLPEAIRAAAQRQGLSIENFRKKTGLSNGRFYELLKGEAPKKLDAIQKLQDAGVVIPKPSGPAPARKGRSSKAA